MKQVDVYRVVVTASYETEADSTQDAVDKTKEYLAAHLDEAEFQVTQREVWVEGAG